ncbi:hypothetical protein BDV95DRAFT_75643 [Massariosphaeria phaeospora]|uniref:Uncharacterized protein n=1 Tax=Massariosphaeria phaeospora TaxID=100035 RepID=A0A7C8I3T4_9PLEO|nr:hypothetical protein BDV95DRAFT_75643 [Massariosphaeria phaeospora]
MPLAIFKICQNWRYGKWRSSSCCSDSSENASMHSEFDGSCGESSACLKDLGIVAVEGPAPVVCLCVASVQAFSSSLPAVFLILMFMCGIMCYFRSREVCWLALVVSFHTSSMKGLLAGTDRETSSSPSR